MTRPRSAAANQESPPAPPAGGLRELKRRRTRATIQREALRLFGEQGYDRTTCEQIAAAAEVSPATLYRYFPTKEDLVLQDDYDDLLVLLIANRPPGETPVRAVRRSLVTALSAFPDADMAAVRERLRLVLSVPALRARRADQSRTTEAVLAPHVAGRLGADPDDLEIKAVTAAIVAAIVTALEHWAAQDGSLTDHIDRALAALETGLSPRRPPRRSTGPATGG
jgi:AcrR family transcriptional regulator